MTRIMLFFAVAALLACSAESQSPSVQSPEPAPVLPAESLSDVAPISSGEIVAPSTWVGRFPCVDCVSIELRIELAENGSYRLTQTFFGTPAGDRSFETSGSWSRARGINENPEATVLLLDPTDGQRQRTLLLVDDGEALELLDSQGYRIAAEEPNRLERTEPAP